MAARYYLYVLLCSDSSLYTGITNDLQRRLESHRTGKGSKYVNSRLPFRLIYQEELASKSSALKREAQIKSWTREEKIGILNLKVSSYA